MTVVDVGINGYVQSIRVRSYYAILLGINPQVSIHRLVVCRGGRKELKPAWSCSYCVQGSFVSEAKEETKADRVKQSRPMRMEYKWGCKKPNKHTTGASAEGGGNKGLLNE